MIFKDESQLIQNIKLEHLYRVYLIYGEENYLKGIYRKKLIKLSTGKSFQDFNLHCFSGNNLDVKQVIEACESLPFMAEQRCVVVDGLDYESLPAADKQKIDTLLGNPPETTVLILLVDKADFQPQKSAKAKKLVEFCDKAGAVINLGRRSQQDMIRFIKAKAENKGCSISRELCLYLMERCENNMLSLINEMEKVTSYALAHAPDGYTQAKEEPKEQQVEVKVEVTKQQVDAVTCKAIGASVYDLAKAILADQFDKAMGIVGELLYLRYQPTLILSTLAGAYTDLYIAKIAKNAGKGESEIKSGFNYRGRDFVVRNNLRECGHYRTEVMRKSVCRLAEVDFRLKSSRAEDSIILEQTVTELFLIAR